MPLSARPPVNKLHHPITRAEYFALPGINQSALKHIAKSPKHFKYRVDHPMVPTAEMQMGAYYDHLVFGSECDVAVCPFDDFRKQEARTWKEENMAAGRTIVTKEQQVRAHRMLEEIKNSPAAQKLLSKGRAQVAFSCELTPGVTGKGLLDWLSDDYFVVVDLKVTTDASRDKFQRHLLAMGYDVQMAMYVWGIEAVTGDACGAAWIVIEDEEPHDVAVWVAEPDILKRGRKLLMDRLALWADCMKSGEWPGYTPQPAPIALPAWETRKLEEI